MISTLYPPPFAVGEFRPVLDPSSPPATAALLSPFSPPAPQVKAARRLLLSGTPVQNDLGELLSLMGFVMPQVFGQDSDIDELLEAFGWDKKSGAAKAGKGANGSGGASINQLRSMLAPFVLRRVKSDVLDQLVEKQAFLEKVPMRRDSHAKRSS